MADKPHAATPARRAEARREGNVPRSPELVGLAAFACAAASLSIERPWLSASAIAAFGAMPAASRADAIADALRHSAPLAVAACLPALAAGVGALVASAFEGGGLRLAFPPPSLSRLNPQAGLARMVSRDALVGALRSLVVFAAVGMAIVPEVDDAVAAASHGAAAWAIAKNGIVRAIGTALAAGTAFVAADYGLARLRWLKQIRMTHDELRRDLREHEGDPMVRGRRAARHRALVRSGVARVRDATFIVTNPTHIAIGMRYAPPLVEVPELVVRATDEVAHRIKTLAREYGIPVVENVSLARLLLAEGRDGQPIPREAYVAVAQVVAALIHSGSDRCRRMTSRTTTYAFAAVVLAIVGILIVPLPPAVLDVLLALDVLGSALILLLSIRVEEPLDFSAFAPTLLLATLFRLSLDVSATRLILTQGHLAGGVGAVIPAFGAFVVRGNLVVGLIVFAILITIQFVVIATGAQRVAEVCARFTLDAMPGKQMAIDADVHAGALDAEVARKKRARVQREADFYAAMDGAGKFVKGDAVAALVIVALNLLGGIVVGVVYHGLSPADSVQTFALLSIGNALVTTLPALLISIEMGLLVTRVAGDGALGVDLRPPAGRASRRVAFCRRARVCIGVRACVARAGVLHGSERACSPSRCSPTAGETRNREAKKPRAWTHAATRCGVRKPRSGSSASTC